MDQVSILILEARSNFERLISHVTSSKLQLMRLESNPKCWTSRCFQSKYFMNKARYDKSDITLKALSNKTN
jgi:hypothetical protein